MLYFIPLFVTTFQFIFIFLLASEDGLSLKPKYWENLFKNICIYLFVFYCFVHLFIALPSDQFAVLYFISAVYNRCL